MPPFCVASYCNQRLKISDSKVSFHKFPIKQPDILQKWIEFVDKGADWKPSRWSAICSQHFNLSDFRLNNLRRILKKHAVPSVLGKAYNEQLKIQNFYEQKSTLKTYSNTNKFSCEARVEKIIDLTCRLCSKRILDQTLLTDIAPIIEDARRIMTCINFDQNESTTAALPKKVCTDCQVIFNFVKDFFEKTRRAQEDLLRQFVTIERTLASNEPETHAAEEIRTPIKIKQEPLVIIKEENPEPVKNTSNTYNVVTDPPQLIKPPIVESPIPVSTNKFNGEIIEVLQLNKNNSQQSMLNLIQPHQMLLNSIDKFQSANDAEDDDIEILDVVPVEQTLKIENVTDVDDEPVQHFNNLLIDEEHSYAKLPDKIELGNCFLRKGKVEVEDDEEEEEEDEHDNDIAIEYKTDDIEMSKLIPEKMAVIDHVCLTCRELFDTPESLRNHEQTMHSFKYKLCSICNEEFKTAHEFIHHKYRMHRKRAKHNIFKRGVNRKTFNCSDCNEILTSRLSLNYHKRFVCNMRTTSASTPAVKPLIEAPKNLRIAVKSERLSLDCLDNIIDVDEIASDRPAFGFQKENHDVKGEYRAETQNRNNWNNCMNTRVSNELNTVGKWTQPFDIGSCEKPVQPNAYVKRLECEQCGKIFQAQSRLNQHKITHTDVRSFKCHLCDKVFKRNCGLNQHIKAFHFKIKPHMCPVCNYRFALKTDMLRCRHSKLKT